jgi:hypothetical protein
VPDIVLGVVLAMVLSAGATMVPGIGPLSYAAIAAGCVALTVRRAPILGLLVCTACMLAYLDADAVAAPGPVRGPRAGHVAHILMIDQTEQKSRSAGLGSPPSVTVMDIPGSESAGGLGELRQRGDSDAGAVRATCSVKVARLWRLKAGCSHRLSEGPWGLCRPGRGLCPGRDEEGK